VTSLAEMLGEDLYNNRKKIKTKRGRMERSDVTGATNIRIKQKRDRRSITSHQLSLRIELTVLDGQKKIKIKSPQTRYSAAVESIIIG
jgi:hypothetical protein